MIESKRKEIIKEHYEDQGVVDHYSDNRFTGRRLRTHKKESKIVDRFFKKIGNVSSILDVPCGAGRFQKQLLQYVDNLTEMDYSHLMAAKAKANMSEKFSEEILHKTKFVSGSIFQIPFPDKSFDLVFSMRIYHHFRTEDDRVNILKELKRVTKDWIILSFYNAFSYQHLRRIIKCKLKKNKAEGALLQ